MTSTQEYTKPEEQGSTAKDFVCKHPKPVFTNSNGEFLGYCYDCNEEVTDNEFLSPAECFDKGRCFECGGRLVADSENVGFDSPDPDKIEINYECEDCGVEPREE